MKFIIILIIYIVSHILAICTNTYLLLLERKYCKHCYWWSDTGAVIMFAINLIPVIGLFSSIIGCENYVKNIIAELDDENT